MRHVRLGAAGTILPGKFLDIKILDVDRPGNGQGTASRVRLTAHS
jgi:hypothetical protein